ncbi:unnamed protein product [Somion occarium]|uniref:Uncharacterized protein n=1 Tax=Somion occarium TaxID=3059160 RepID=A0ABP1E4V0_9APHY
MVNPLASPNRSPTVKKTYLGRQRKRRESVSRESDSDNMAESDTTRSTPMPTITPAKKHAPKTRGKAIASSSPPPPPSSPVASMKPPSTVNVKSSMKAPSKVSHSRGASVASDGGSLEGSSVLPTWSVGKSGTTRARKSEEERMQFFKDDPLCKDVEPHRALCARCDTWVELNPKRRYIMKDWITHRKACRRESEEEHIPPAAIGQEEENEEEEDDGGSVAASTVPSTPAPGEKPRRQVRTEAERQALLEADPRIGEVKPHEVFCKQCGRWIRLNPTQKFTVGNWNNHAKRCSIKKTGVSHVNGDETTVDKPEVPPTKPGPPSGALTTPPAPSTGPPTAVPSSTETPSRKRPREDETDEEDASRTQVEARLVKARTENYKPAEGLWRTMTNTFRSFIDGLWHGLTADETSPVNDEPSTSA